MSDFSDIYSPQKTQIEQQVRPQNLSEFIGQKEVTDNLKVFISAAAKRRESLDHLLLSGPPGLGKTTLARIIAQQFNAKFTQIAAPNLKRIGDVVKILSGLSEFEVLFIDEIHRLSSQIEETLYSAMEDRTIDITLGDQNLASALQINLPMFTLVGATTKPGDLTGPFRDRFGIKFHIEFYDTSEIAEIVRRAADVWKIQLEPKALEIISERARNTPRIALTLLRRVWDFALVEKNNDANIIHPEIALSAFEKMSIDALGLTRLDNEFMKTIARMYDGGPVGLKPIAAVLAEDESTLESYIEPYLVRLGFIKRTPRGRMLSREAYQHLKLPQKNKQEDLFE